MKRWNSEQVIEYTAGRFSSRADRYILKVLKEISPQRLVEIGCGPGIVYKKAEFVSEYLCTDITFDFLKVAFRASPAGMFINCTAEVLPFSDSFTDCVLAMAVLHHLEEDNLRQALREIYRILKPGGSFLLLEDWSFSHGATGFEKMAREWRFRNGSSENHLSARKWCYELSTAGFNCGEPVFVTRPFTTKAPHLLKWPEEKRTVRMMALESVKQP